MESIQSLYLILDAFAEPWYIFITNTTTKFNLQDWFHSWSDILPILRSRHDIGIFEIYTCTRIFGMRINLRKDFKFFNTFKFPPAFLNSYHSHMSIWNL